MRVSKLRDQLNTPYPRPFLVCQECDAEWSANRGDYWNLPDDDVLTCCDKPLRRVRRIETLEAI